MTAIAERPLAAGAQPGPLESVRHATDRAREHLLALQDSAGWWKGELATNVTMDAEDLLLREFLGIRTPADSAAAARWIRSQQREDGTWGAFHGGPPELSITVEAYVALELCGDPVDAPHMKLAVDWIQENGGVERTRVFTRVWLALFGLWDWERLPVMPPELIFLPPQVPLNIYDWGCWARQTVVPLTVVAHFRPVRPIPIGIDELRTGADDPPFQPVLSTGGFFQRADQLLHRYERLRVKPGRKAALRRAVEWIVARQEADGGWGGIQPPWVYSIMALHLMGYQLDHPVIRAALDGLEGFLVREDSPDGPVRRLEACQSPVWDTALAMVALTDAGVRGDHPAIVKAADWMLGEEITVKGDWSVRRPQLAPGGWAFEFANDGYPDTDDTAEVVIALLRAARDGGEPARLAALRGAIDRGVRWMAGMQSKDGGWAAFDADNTRYLINKLPFCDFGAVIDPPSADVTAHIAEAMALDGRAHDPRALRGVRWLLDHQEKDGSWFGRWGANHVYGTGAVVPALVEMGVDRGHPAVRRAAQWLIDHQNPDGGWGEDLRSYADPAWIGRGESTASQTAWAMLALLAAQEPGGHDRAVAVRAAADRGAEYLARTQRADGTWDEDLFTGTGFPGDFYINYHLYRLVFPLTALGRYLADRLVESPVNAATGIVHIPPATTDAQDGHRPKLTIAAALAIEARALEKGLSGAHDVRVVRVGQRARNAVRVLPRDDDALIVAGVAGGVAPHVRAGDIVVATEVHGPEGSIVRSPAAPLLAAAIRALGLESPAGGPVRVHLGPIATTDRLALGARRRVLAAEGVAAVDLESSWLGTLANRPFAVVRVIVDDSETGLYHPATVTRGRAAIQTLSKIVPALERWGDAVRGRRRVVLASPRSFCAGVERAIEIVEEALERYGAPVYVRRQIVHNAYVVADLERRGAVFVEELDEVPDGVPVVLSAHGVAPAVREEAARRGLAVVDATCPLVAKVHTEARRALRDGNTVVFIGHPNHDESEGLLGEDPDVANPRIHLVESAKQAKELEVEDPAKLAYLMQTTLAEDEAEDIVAALRATFPGIAEPPSSDICYATTNRQRAIRDIAAEVDVVLVVGSQNSSNSKRLVEVAERAGAAAYLIDGADEIDPAWLAGARSVGLTAGASAPPKLVDEVADALSGLGPVDREDPPGVAESYKFTVPPMPPLATARRSGAAEGRSAVGSDLDTGVAGVPGVTGVVNGPSVGPELSTGS